MQGAGRYITYQPGRMGKSHAEHEAIIKAIDTGNADEAQRLMCTHVNMLGEVVADFIASLAGLPVPEIRSES